MRFGSASFARSICAMVAISIGGAMGLALAEAQPPPGVEWHSFIAEAVRETLLNGLTSSQASLPPTP